jgi:hypothetical protein
MADKISMVECLVVASGTPELVKEFDRLTGHNLSRNGSPLDLAIDDATGRTEDGAKDFINFVRECVFERIQKEKANS